MLKRIYRPALAAVLMSALIGCETTGPMPETNPLVAAPLDPDVMHKYSEPMMNNAAASNMSVGDRCFYPHTTELNSLGTKQLDRLMAPLERFGGTVCYETRSMDKDMVSARIKSVEAYLTDSGMDMSHVKVEAKLSGGLGTSARRGIDAAAAAALAAKKSGGGTSKEKVEKE